MGAALPWSGPGATVGIANKVTGLTRIAKAGETASVARQVAGGLTSLALDGAASASVTALNSDASLADAFLANMSPGAVLSTAIGTGSLAAYQNRAMRRAAKLQGAADDFGKAGQKLADAKEAISAPVTKVAKDGVMEAAAPELADSAKAVQAAKQRVAEVDLDAGAMKLDDAAYDELRPTFDKVSSNAKEGKRALADIRRQEAQTVKKHTEAKIDADKYDQDVALYDAKEAARVADIRSGRLVKEHAEQVAAHAQGQAAELVKLKKQYATQQGSKKGVFLPEHEEGFDRWLKETDMGHLSQEGKAMGSLADRFEARLQAMGEDVPTTEDGIRKLFSEFAEDEGYRIAKPIPGRKTVEVDEGLAAYDGFLPEHNLRPLSPDEASRTFEFTGQIGSEAKRKMTLTADQARTLSSGRALELLGGLDAHDREALLRMMSPITRAHVLLKSAGLIRHADANLLKFHKMRTTPFSERSARLRHELEDAFVETFDTNKAAIARAPKTAPKALTAEDLDETIRPFPGAKPITDYSEQINALRTKAAEVESAVQHLDNLRLPTTAKGFVKMGGPEFNKMSESVRALKNHPNYDIADAAQEVEDGVRKTLENMGVDVEAMVESEGDVMGVLTHVRKELRDHPGNVAKLKAEAKAEYEAAKQADMDLSKRTKAAANEAGGAEAAAIKVDKATKRAAYETAKGDFKAAEAAAIGAGGAAVEGGIKRQAAGIFGRYMGSKILMGAAAAAGFSGNGVMSAAGFAIGGAFGGAAGKAAMTRKVMSVEAMIQKAQRSERMAKVIGAVSQLGQRVAPRANSTYNTIFATKEEDFEDMFDGQAKPADDSEAVYLLATMGAAAFSDPPSAGYRATGDMPFTNPKVAVNLAKAMERKIHALGTVLPAVPPNGFNSVAGSKSKLHPEEIDSVKRAISAITRPTETLSGMIATGHFPQRELDLIRETDPDFYTESMFKLANELFAEDEDGKTVLSKMTHNQQLEFTTAMGIDTIAGSAPGYTAYIQNKHAEARQPKPDSQAKPLSSGNGIKAPSAENNTTSTNAQQATYR